ncbi:MAG: hypothetical protein HOO06_09195 [Bdellovibrionaceae bacterium]|nr:hypothetical protein [Pseudobdellovibrionaceae bacterium]
MQKTLLAGFLMLALFISKNSMAGNNLLVFDVKKSLPLSDKETVYKDFYINGGDEYGLRPGMLVTVYRSKAMYDNYSNKSAGDLKIFVGRLKIIHVQNGLAVARMFSTLSRKRLPILEYTTIMVGDRLDMNTLEMDRGSKKRKSAHKKKPTAPKPMKQEMEQVSMNLQMPDKPVQMPNMQ